jgi:hypothetical protein
MMKGTSFCCLSGGTVITVRNGATLNLSNGTLNIAEGMTDW